MTTFSSNISRIRQCVEAAIKFNRKIIFLGRSMKENTKLAAEIGYLPIPFKLMGDEKDVRRLPPNKVCLIAAGSQGQYSSALSKLAQNQNKFVKIQKGDKVLFSSDPIPGNENEVYGVIEELWLLGAEVVYSDIREQTHASGHGNQGDMMLMARLTNPKFFVPIGGTIRHQRMYRDLMGTMGYNEKNIHLLNEGETLWFENGNVRLGDPVETKSIYVDAYGIGDVGTIVLRDRTTLATDGIVVAFVVISKDGTLATPPRLISKGFIFEKDQGPLFDDATRIIEASIKPHGTQLADYTAVKKHIASKLENLFYRSSGRNPLVVVEIMNP